jgi:ABC-type transport system involved in multi-copper enzyme maturation permease subunit
MQRLFAIVWLTWKAAVRFRLFLVVAVLLLGAVVGLPLLIKDDGTARGFTQILLTYTLGTVSTLLGLCTLWLACGTLAREIEDCQMQVVAVKPIARWQIWLGKWLGIVSLNAALLALSGAGIYFLLQYRATQLPADQQQILRREVLVARGSVKEPVGEREKEIDQETDRLLRERLQQNQVEQANLVEVRRQLREYVKSEFQLVPPGYTREWQIDLGLARYLVRGQPLQLRIKFNSADTNPNTTFAGLWFVGVPGETKLWRSEPMSLAPDTFHEFEIPADLLSDKGVLTVNFVNPNQKALLFPIEDGIEVLYPEGGFGLNFIRGVAIILCWMALLAALGLAASSFLSFPVAAFVSLGALAVVLSSGTMANAVAEGTIADYNAEKGIKGYTPLDEVVIPAFRATLKLINLAKDFSPIDALSTGRSISWEQLARAFGQIVVLLCGALGVFGITAFTRRELAAAQGTQ